MNASIAQVDEVHLPQVRDERGAGEARRALHPATQHLQREDLHLPLVLDAHPQRPHQRGRRLQVNKYIIRLILIT